MDSDQCRTCRNYIGAGLCSAFPEDPGIPDAIMTGVYDHTKPYPGDNDIGWQRRQSPSDAEPQPLGQEDRNTP
jgi:hypothetical protein